MRRRVPFLRLASAVVAVLGLVGLIGLWQTGPARGDTPVDQITGNGSTDSEVTVKWADGLVGADNTTVVTPRGPSSPLAFMYPDFQNLSVTVSQTKNIVHQSIKVTWTGGKATTQPFVKNFLQVMQCYGDANTGPTPEQCEYGSRGMIPAGAINSNASGRAGNRCASHTASVTDPPGTFTGAGASLGCDPGEPTDPSHLAPCNGCTQSGYSVPFTPVGTTDKVYGSVTDYYDQFNTNEMQQVSTNPNGTGQVFFQALTATQAPGLGCGAAKPDGTTRDCWLVIVPRGEYEPNGWKTNESSGQPGYINESPLGASSWAQRIQIHLSFDPLKPNCPFGTKERSTVGTELAARAVFSWQLALNLAANCRTIYSYAATPEAAATAQFINSTGTGLAFTTVPIGSEATRSGGAPPDLPPVAYAPVGLSATTFGFNISLLDGFVSTPIKLTPRLLAKALTQSYKFDMPDVDNSHPVDPNNPDRNWAVKNPEFITQDPEFQKLNPEVGTPNAALPLAPLLTEDHSAVNQQVWAWIQSDQAARTWLAGTPDENGMRVNEAYKNLKLDQPPPLDSYPRADPTCSKNGVPPDLPADKLAQRCSIDLLPYVNNLDDAASHVRAANNPEGATWDTLKQAPDNTIGWWSSGGIEPAGQVFMWGAMDSADLANYGLVPADLCDASGNNCVSANVNSVATALDSANFAGSELPSIDPAKVGPGGYPLVQITYAAVRLDQDLDALKEYGQLIAYAAGQGQTAGVEPGQLPHGYLPLPTKWRDVSEQIANILIKGPPSPTPGTTTTPPRQSTGGVINSQPAPRGLPAVGLPATASASPLPYVTTKVSAEAAAKTTEPTPMGSVRWALIVMVAAGVAGSVGGPLLRLAFGGRRPPGQPL